MQRARRAFDRHAAAHPIVLQQLAARSVFNVTELERFADCSSAWFFDRFVDPRTIDAEVDAKLRGQVAHTALYRFFSGCRRSSALRGSSRSRSRTPCAFMRECLERRARGRAHGDDADAAPRARAGALARPRAGLVRDEAETERTLEPRQFEVSFGMERSAPELQRGLDLGDGLTLSGKIDRIDVDPFSARGIVQDYKSGKHAPSAREIEQELRLQIPLYMLVLRDLVGIEPLGGVYRPLAAAQAARPAPRDAKTTCCPATRGTTTSTTTRSGRRSSGADDRARARRRIRAGDVRHDPRGGECPTWCDLWPMCRVKRA